MRVSQIWVVSADVSPEAWSHYTTPRWSALSPGSWGRRTRPSGGWWSASGTLATPGPPGDARTASTPCPCLGRAAPAAPCLTSPPGWRCPRGKSLGSGQCHWHILCDTLCTLSRSISGLGWSSPCNTGTCNKKVSLLESSQIKMFFFFKQDTFETVSQGYHPLIRSSLWVYQFMNTRVQLIWNSNLLYILSTSNPVYDLPK